MRSATWAALCASVVLSLNAPRVIGDPSEADARQAIIRTMPNCNVVRVCPTASTERERVMCIAKLLFSTVPMNGSGVVDHGVIVYTNSQGWGNCANGITATLPFAASLGRRIIVSIPFYQRSFLPPDGSPDWPKAIIKPPHDLFSAIEAYRTNMFGGERSDETRSAAKKWMHDVEWGIIKYEEPAYWSSTNMDVNNGGVSYCLKSALGVPEAAKCLDDRTDAITFAGLVQRPSPVMVEALALIRKRLSLQELPPGTEPHPGAWGLRTPGVYILALHFRSIPQGFEAIANSAEVHRGNVFLPFLDAAENVAQHAADLASCRGLGELLIYFATDHARALREPVAERLSKYGRVVFGLNEDEVGHVNPDFFKNDFEEFDRKKAACKKLAAEEKFDVNHSMYDSCRLMEVPPRSKNEVELHQVMGMAEWWILAQSQWLLSAGSSFSETAAKVGLGPMGAMERFGKMRQFKVGTGAKFVHDTVRKDFDGPNPCAEVLAADPTDAKLCPNLG